MLRRSFFLVLLLVFAVLLHVPTRISARQVQSQPYFRSVPTTVRAKENTSAALPCQVENLGAATVQWWRGDVMVAERVALYDNPLRSAVEPRATLRTDNALEVVDLQVTDTGEYMCQIVQSPPWLPLRQIHRIEVLYRASVSLVPSDEVVVKLGDQVDLLCNATGVPTPIILWTFTGNLSLEKDELRELRRRPRLQFVASSRHVAGEYRCDAFNDVGYPASASLRLIVQHPPEVTAEKAWVNTAMYLYAVLTCIVTAEPKAQVTWLRPLSGPEQYKKTYFTNSFVSGDRHHHSLAIDSVRAGDLGNYTCRATNDMGQTDTLIQLSGLPNPAVIKGESLNDNCYNIIWVVDSYSRIFEYMLKFRKHGASEWYNLTIPARSAQHDITLHSCSYVLIGLEAATQYEVQIYSRNYFGWSAPSSEFTFSTLGRVKSNTLHLEMQTGEDDVAIPMVKNIIDIDASKPSSALKSVAHLVTIKMSILIMCLALRPLVS